VTSDGCDNRTPYKARGFPLAHEKPVPQFYKNSILLNERSQTTQVRNMEVLPESAGYFFLRTTPADFRFKALCDFLNKKVEI